MSDYRYLNDRLELNNTYELLLKNLSPVERESFDVAFRLVSSVNFYCVFSLSRSPKILSQWRAYASDGSGIALGLDGETLEREGLRLLQCQYLDHELYVERLIRKHAAFFEELCTARSQYPEIYFGEPSSQLPVATPKFHPFQDWVRGRQLEFESLIADLISEKNPEFVEEQEVRAMRVVSLLDAKTRVVNGVVVPFTTAGIWNDTLKDYLGYCVREIWLGPKCSELNRLSFFSISMNSAILRYDCGSI